MSKPGHEGFLISSDRKLVRFMHKVSARKLHFPNQNETF
jgi:hypothetical protein